MGLSAFGAMLAMLPVITIVTLALLELLKINDQDVSVIMSVVQLIGCALWVIGLFNASSVMGKMKLPTGAVMGTALTVMLAGVLQLVFFVISKDAYRFYGSPNDLEGVGLVMLILYFAIQIVMWVCTSKIASVISGIDNARNGIAMITIVSFVLLVIMIILFKKLDNSYYGSDARSLLKTIEIIAKIGSVLLLIGAIWSVVGWWSAVGGASNVDVEDEEETVAQVTAVSEVTEQQRQTLLGYDNARLQDIADHPEMYANSALVTEAVSILKKRKAWELIKDKSDEELMAMVESTDGLYDYAVLDAASMELASRQSPLLMNVLKSYTPDQLRQIVSDPGSYFDGYVKMARQIIEEQ